MPDETLSRGVRSKTAGRSLARGRLLAALGVITFIMLVVIGGVPILRALMPRLSQADATAIARRQVSQMDPGVHGFFVVSAHYDPAPDRVYDDRGNLIYSETPQTGFANHEGFVMVNGHDGSVSSASTNSS